MTESKRKNAVKDQAAQANHGSNKEGKNFTEKAAELAAKLKKSDSLNDLGESCQELLDEPF